MSYAVPNRGLPNRAWPNRGLPVGPSGAFISNAEQWGAIPRRGIGVGALPLYGIPEASASFVSLAKQIGAIPERGVATGTIILRGIPIFGYVEPVPIPSVGGGGIIARREELRRAMLLKNDQDFMELLTLIAPIILN